MRVQYCRLNLLASYENYEEKDLFLQKTFYSNIKIKQTKYIWELISVEEIIQKDKKIYTAQLVKYDPSARSEVLKTSKEIDEEITTNKIEDKIFFSLERNSGLIAYQHSSSLNESSFRNVIKEIIEKSNDNFFITADLVTITNKDKFSEALKKIKHVSFISITLHPSNPTFKDFYKETDENLKLAKIKQLTETATPASDEGIILENYPLFPEKVAMTLDGYGNTKLKGIIEGKKRTISTETTPYETIIPADKETDIKELKLIFIELLEKIKNYIYDTKN